MSDDVLRPDGVEVPHPSRFPDTHPDFEAAMAAHATALEHGDDLYRDPRTGYWVMTGRYLADRGYCCQRGCRHCPWVH